MRRSAPSRKAIDLASLEALVYFEHQCSLVIAKLQLAIAQSNSAATELFRVAMSGSWADLSDAFISTSLTYINDGATKVFCLPIIAHHHVKTRLTS